jgi:DNA-binding NarL/FixJ family response regulator
MRQVQVFVHASDPISQAGIASQLRSRPELWVVEENEAQGDAVCLVVCDELDEPTLRSVKVRRRNGANPVVLVLTKLDDKGVLAAVEAGACGLLRRSDATPERLAMAARAAASGEGSMPPDLLGRLLDQVGRLQRQVLAPRGLTFTGLTEREICVLKLVAEGHETSEIAQELSYSERTIKNVIHDLTTRLNLRNRAHAVAYALKQGLI